MAGFNTKVHLKFAPMFGPASRFVPPTLQVQENADPGGGQPNEPNALVFADPRDGETHVFLLSDEMRKQLVSLLTGGIVIAGRIAEEPLNPDGGDGE